MNARLTPTLFAHAEALLGKLLRFAQPADGLVSSHFREHRSLGHADRAFVAESVYGVLRRRRSLEARCDGRITPRRLLLAALAVSGWSQRRLEPVLKASEAEWLGAAKALQEENLPAAVRADLPDWLYEALVAQSGEAPTLALAQALKAAAPLDVRVNTLKAERGAVLDQLQAEGIAATPGKWSPLALRLTGKPALARHPLFLEGRLEVQDEGSQILGFLVAPRRGEWVIDFCAGAGGKTLLLGDLMKNSGRLYAFDVSEKRLARLKPRLARSGLSNVHPVRIAHEGDARVKRLAGKADRVLVDAPCSGLGTLRRNPDLKWRQTPASIAELAAKQAAILRAAATLVRPGGRLIYATCSLLDAENLRVAEDFLQSHPGFHLLPAGDILQKQGIDLPGEHLCLLPQIHGSDGFFAAVFEKQK